MRWAFITTTTCDTAGSTLGRGRRRSAGFEEGFAYWRNGPEHLRYYFPEGDEEYPNWHIHPPLDSNDVIWSPKNRRVIRFCAQQVINACANMMLARPDEYEEARVVALVDTRNLFHSSLDVFFDEEYFRQFFVRGNQYQRWDPLPPSRSLAAEWNLILPSFPRPVWEKGYSMWDCDDGCGERVGELWCYGDLYWKRKGRGRSSQPV